MMHTDRVYVLYGTELRRPSALQLLEILKYQLGRRYNSKVLRNAKTATPYLVDENGAKQAIFFFSS